MGLFEFVGVCIKSVCYVCIVIVSVDVCQCMYQICIYSVCVCVSDKHRTGGGSTGSAALYLQTGADRGGCQPGETLEVLWFRGNQDQIEHYRDTADITETQKKQH